MFDRLTFQKTQGRITVIDVSFAVSTTAPTVDIPGVIKFMPYWYQPVQESNLGFEFVTAPVWFPVDFPALGQIYYKWMVVQYRYRAGGVDELRTDYIGLQAFVQN